MEADAGRRLEELRVDGGAAANDLLLQMQADLLQRPIVRPTVLETTADGLDALRVRFDFAESLESDTHLLLTWNGEAFVPLDYAELRDPNSLEPAPGRLSEPSVLALAVFFRPVQGSPGETVRLIDNRVLRPQRSMEDPP